MQVLNRESGMNVVQQSHKNKIKNVSINSFVRFAKQYNICLDEDKPEDFVPTSIFDVYQQGIDAVEEDFTNRKGGLDRLKPAYLFDQEVDHPDNTQIPEEIRDSDTSKTTAVYTSDNSDTSVDFDTSGSSDKSKQNGSSNESESSNQTDKSNDQSVSQSFYPPSSKSFALALASVARICLNFSRAVASAARLAVFSAKI
jgi:hypothetical protein